MPTDENNEPLPESDPELTEIAQISTNGETMKIQVHNDVAFAIDTADNNPGGLVAINISDPHNPTIIGSYYDAGMPIEFAIQGDIAYIANMFDGLEVLDISDLSSINRIGHYRPGETVYDVKVNGDLVFLGGKTRGLEIVNVSDPTLPVMVSSTSLSGWGIKLEIVNEVCYITDHLSYYTNIEAYDVSTPLTPQYLGGYQVNNVDFFNMHISGDVLYIADHGSTGDVFILDIEDPSAIEEIARFDTGGTAYGMDIQGDIAYFTDYEMGLFLVNITDLSNPVQLENHNEGGAGQDVCVVGEFIYFANRHGGLEILQYS
jgi:hypothetical protein